MRAHSPALSSNMVQPHAEASESSSHPNGDLTITPRQTSNRDENWRNKFSFFINMNQVSCNTLQKGPEIELAWRDSAKVQNLDEQGTFSADSSYQHLPSLTTMPIIGRGGRVVRKRPIFSCWKAVVALLLLCYPAMPLSSPSQPARRRHRRSNTGSQRKNPIPPRGVGTSTARRIHRIKGQLFKLQRIEPSLSPSWKQLQRESSMLERLPITVEREQKQKPQLHSLSESGNTSEETTPKISSTREILTFCIPAIFVLLCMPLLSLQDTSAVGRVVGGGTAQQAALNPAIAVITYASKLLVSKAK
jgi:hypothetical protein